MAENNQDKNGGYDCDRKQIHGLAGAKLNYRIHVPKNETRMQRLNRVRESNLWGDLVDKVGSAPQGSQWIHVFDRGGANNPRVPK